MNPKAFNESLKYLKDMAYAYECMDVCQFIFDDPRFNFCSGSGKPHQHHNGDGGLVIHTAEVVKLCQQNNQLCDWSLNPNLWDGGGDNQVITACNPDQLFLAAFFHDVGKMWDYQRVPAEGSCGSDETNVTVWTGTEHRRNIHHISRSAITWQQCIDKVNATCWQRNIAPKYSQEFTDEILHAILAHHGLREWGSPVAPNSKLAWLLHLCDGLSARLDDCDEFDHIKEKS